MRRQAALLLALYALQGIPFGMVTGALPVLLKAQGVGYAEIGWLSLAALPFATKALVAPVVDTYWRSSPGRRKSWVLPCTLLSALLFALLALRVDAYLAAGAAAPLAAWFFSAILALSFQDVAVDAWAITLLGPDGLAYASSCQTLGMTGGNALGYPLVLALCDAALSQRLFGWAAPLPLSLALWAVVALHVAVAAAALLEPEQPPSADEERLTAGTVFRQLRALALRRESLLLLVFAMLHRLGAMHLDTTTLVRFVELGGSADQLSAMFVLQLPLVVAVSWVAASRISGGDSTSLDVMMRGYSVLLVAGALLPLALDYSLSQGPLSPAGLGLLCLLFSLSSVGNKLFFTAQGAFFNGIADPLVTGTHLTLLNAMSNLGRFLPRYPCFFLTDRFGYDAVAAGCVLLGALLFVPLRRVIASVRPGKSL